MNTSMVLWFFISVGLQIQFFQCRKKLAVFWGANRAARYGQEPPLKYFCDKNRFDIIIMTSLTSYMPTLNLENLPSLDFRGHCGDNLMKGESGILSYLKCPTMEKQIKYCQRKGVRIVLDVKMTTGFHSKKMAEEFAQQVWGLFLGGNFQKKWRTFGRAVLDGINLTPVSVKYAVEIRHVADFARALRKLMNKSKRKKYFLTYSPNCVQQPHALDHAFKHLFSAFDSIYVNFADQRCKISDQVLFNKELATWLFYAAKSNGPDLYVTVTTHVSPTFVNRNITRDLLLEGTFRKYRSEIGGIAFNDASWDNNYNIINGQSYSGFVSSYYDKRNSKFNRGGGIGGGGGGGSGVSGGDGGSGSSVIPGFNTRQFGHSSAFTCLPTIMTIAIMTIPYVLI